MPSIKKNFLYSGILTTANILFPLIVYPYVSRVLGVANIGLCNFIDSLINYFVLFSTLGISVLGIREIAAALKDRDKLNSAFSTLFILNVITTAIMMVVLVLVTIFVTRLRDNWPLMIVGAFKLLFNVLLVEWLYKGLEEFRYITIRTLIVRVLYVVLVFLFVRNQSDYLIYYVLTTFMVVVNAIINMGHSRTFVTFSLKYLHLKEFVKPYCELGVYQILTSMYTSLNVAYLGFVATNTDVGYYTTAIKLYSIFLALFTAFTGVMLPRMSSLFAEDDIQSIKQYIAKSFSFLFAMTIPLVMFSIVNAEGIIRLISGAGYEGAIVPMMLVMPLLLIVGSEQILIEQVLMPIKKDKTVTINSFVGAGLGVLLNLLLVPHFLSIGSALVIAISESAIFILAMIEVKRYLGYNYPWRDFFKRLLVYLPFLGMELLLLPFVESSLIRLLINSLVVIMYVLIVNQYILRDYDILQLVRTVLGRREAEPANLKDGY